MAEPAVDIFTLELLGGGLHCLDEESFHGGSSSVLRCGSSQLKHNGPRPRKGTTRTATSCKVYDLRSATYAFRVSKPWTAPRSATKESIATWRPRAFAVTSLRDEQPVGGVVT